LAAGRYRTLDHINTHAHALRQRSERSRLRIGIRDIVVAASSLGVVALLILYAVAAPSAKLAASFGPVVPRPGANAVVEGRVLESDGGGLQGARIVVREGGQPVANARSRDDGAFRVDLRGSCASYDISIQARASGSDVDAATRRQLCPGDALPVDARVVTEGHFLWVPGPR
jgi:hypothetical protein